MIQGSLRRLYAHKLALLLILLGLSAVGAYEEEEDECGCKEDARRSSGIIISPDPSFELTEGETHSVTASTKSGRSADWTVKWAAFLKSVSATRSSGTSTTITVTAVDTFLELKEYRSGIAHSLGYTDTFVGVYALESGAESDFRTSLDIALIPSQVGFDMHKNKGDACTFDMIAEGTTAKVFVFAMDKPTEEYEFTGATTGTNREAAAVVGVERLGPQSAFLLVKAYKPDSFLIKASGKRLADGRTQYAYERFQDPQ
jgi:hypothetical protein